jgi:putative FmdB family regulatory protein
MPLYDFRCDDCGSFEIWRTMAEFSQPVHCPTCTEPAKRVFSPPALLSGSLRLRTEREPQLIKRDCDPVPSSPKAQNCGRPWMLGHSRPL